METRHAFICYISIIRFKRITLFRIYVVFSFKYPVDGSDSINIVSSTCGSVVCNGEIEFRVRIYFRWEGVVFFFSILQFLPLVSSDIFSFYQKEYFCVFQAHVYSRGGKGDINSSLPILTGRYGFQASGNHGSFNRDGIFFFFYLFSIHHQLRNKCYGLSRLHLSFAAFQLFLPFMYNNLPFNDFLPFMQNGGGFGGAGIEV